MWTDLTRTRALWIIERYRAGQGPTQSRAQDKVLASPMWRRMRHSLSAETYRMLQGLHLESRDEVDLISAYRCQRLAEACRDQLTFEEYESLTSAWAIAAA